MDTKIPATPARPNLIGRADALANEPDATMIDRLIDLTKLALAEVDRMLSILDDIKARADELEGGSK